MSSSNQRFSSGVVYLVGAGPGDPGLLTLRGRDLLSSADCVIYDYLADLSLLKYVPSDAEIIDVGKRPDRPMPQDEINEIILACAKRHERVVRLKGGDPMLFGRGGEEAMALVEHKIRFEVVPGVSSAIAVPAYAGIPVTHRGVSNTLTIVTGHRQGGGEGEMDFEALVRLGGTIVVLMGVAHRKAIAQGLIDAGMASNTPAASIQWGTKAAQKSWRGTVGELGEASISSPSTIVIGAVASFNLDFFESRPLFGKKIVITRAPRQTGLLEGQLRLLGAEVVVAPSIDIAPPFDNYNSLDREISRIETYEYLIFTSVNAVEAFFSRINDIRRLARLKLVAIGTSTQKAIESFQLRVDLVPREAHQEALLKEFPIDKGRVLYPRAEIVRDLLIHGLIELGHEVVDPIAYRNVDYDPSEIEIDAILGCDGICFTSSSSVVNFLKIYSKDRLPRSVFSIGPITTKTARDCGIEVSATADLHNLDGLVETLVAFFANDFPSVDRIG